MPAQPWRNYAGCRSNVERLIALSTSAVAVCCSYHEKSNHLFELSVVHWDTLPQREFQTRDGVVLSQRTLRGPPRKTNLPSRLTNPTAPSLASQYPLRVNRVISRGRGEVHPYRETENQTKIWTVLLEED